MPAGDDRIAVRVVRDGKLSEFLLRSRNLKVLNVYPGRTLAEELREGYDVPAGMILNTVSEISTGASLAWATLPRNRDRPRTEIPPPTKLMLVIPDNWKTSH